MKGFTEGLPVLGPILFAMLLFPVFVLGLLLCSTTGVINVTMAFATSIAVYMISCVIASVSFSLGMSLFTLKCMLVLSEFYFLHHEFSPVLYEVNTNGGSDCIYIACLNICMFTR